MKVVSLLIMLCLFVAGCGGSPTSPGGTQTGQYPGVAGSYSGTTVMTFPELSETVSCPTTTSVTQSEAQVTIAPFVLTGACGGLSVPFGTALIDGQGAFVAASSGTFNDPECGAYNYTFSGGFFDREMRMTMRATSSVCYNFDLTISVFR